VGPARPRWAPQVEMVRRALHSRPARPAEPPAPRPRLIVVIASERQSRTSSLSSPRSRLITLALRSARANATARKTGPQALAPADERHVPDTPTARLRALDAKRAGKPRRDRAVRRCVREPTTAAKQQLGLE